MTARVERALASLREHATDATREGLVRYAIPNERALGVKMADVQKIAKQLGRDPALADALWATGVYEARLLCAYVDDPATLTPERMDAYCRDFDNWAVCDTLCFSLFDRSTHAWTMVERWADDDAEFVRRAAFALIASIALHDKKAKDAPFVHALTLIERHARDERNFVKKGVSWALRGIGRRNATLMQAAMRVADGLAASKQPAERWVGKDAQRDLRKFAKRRMG